MKEAVERKKAQDVKTVAVFLQNKQRHFDAVRAERDLWKSQLSCQQLDTLKVNQL